MNRIKIIKRANLQSPPEARKIEAEKINPAVIKRQEVKIVVNWIDEWRASNPRDARSAFAELFV